MCNLCWICLLKPGKDVINQFTHHEWIQVNQLIDWLTWLYIWLILYLFYSLWLSCMEPSPKLFGYYTCSPERTGASISNLFQYIIPSCAQPMYRQHKRKKPLSKVVKAIDYLPHGHINLYLQGNSGPIIYINLLWWKVQWISIIWLYDGMDCGFSDPITTPIMLPFLHQPAACGFSRLFFSGNTKNFIMNMFVFLFCRKYWYLATASCAHILKVKVNIDIGWSIWAKIW